MRKKSLLKSNRSIVGIAFFLSFAVYSLATNYTDVATNIQGAVVGQEVTADLRLSIEGDTVVVSSQKDISGVTAMSMLALYDTQAINWDDDGVDADFPITVVSNEPGEVSIVMTLWENEEIRAGQSLLVLRINWDPYALSISDIAITFAWWDAESVTFEVP